MKPILLFCFNRYYPLGGLKDLKKSFDTIEEVYDFLSRNYSDYSSFDYYQILDMSNGYTFDLDFSLIEDKELDDD